MSNNQYGYKQRVAPNDYLNGPVRVFTSDEIAEWETTRGAAECRAKVEAQAGMDEAQIKFLDTLSRIEAENAFAEVMEGVGSGDKE
jgi:hypothetical protein